MAEKCAEPDFLVLNVIWDSARQMAAQREAAAKPQERTLVVLGSKGAGKTQLIYNLLDRSDTPKPTLALEYCFGRKQKRNLNKVICHIWELGGGTVFNSLIEQLITSPLKSEHPVSVIILLDLSAPHQLWRTLEIFTGALSNAFKEFRKQNPEQFDVLLEAKKSKYPHLQDDSCLDLIPINLCIFGGKYDIFKDMDPELKKIMCRCIRAVTLVYGADLYFYSARDSTLVKRARDVIAHAAFDDSAVSTITVDHNSPLAIPFGSDSFEKIGLGRVSGASSTLEKAKHLYSSNFTPDKEDLIELDDPALNPSFREPLIDALRGQIDEQIEKVTQELYRKLNASQDAN